MLKKIDKRRILKELFMCLFVVVISIGLSGVRIFYNNFIFIVPFVIFCFMNNKWYGYLSFFSSFFVIGSYNKYFYLSYLMVLLSMFAFKFFVKKDNVKFKNIISFYAFFITVIEYLIAMFIYKLDNYLIAFIFGVISYWIMRFFCDLYINVHVSEKRYLTPFLLAFVLSILGLSVLGLYNGINSFSVSLTIILFLGMIGSKVSLDSGVLYGFIMILITKTLNIEIELMLLVSSFLIVYLLNNTSKVTFLFTYTLLVIFYLYYNNISYLEGVNYILGAVLFIITPKAIFNYLGELCYGSNKYIERITKDNKRFNLEIGNKILKMEEVFSLVTSKFNVNGRLRKCEKELLFEEISIFDKLLKNFSTEINKRYEFNYYSNIEKELYKYGYDLLYFDVKTDVFNDFVINMNVRCEKKEIYKVIKPLISKLLKKKIGIINIKHNNIFDYYEVKLREEKIYRFNYGINQIAKDKEVCGDSYLVYENEGKIIYALSDGMGVGKKAKEKSKIALDLLKKFIDIGFEEECAINSINCILKSEYNKESYATLDLFVYDKYTNEFSFYKNGACDSYILRNKEIISIEGEKLPIGIMDKIDVNKKVVEIKKGDYVVMASDGVSERKINKIKDIKTNDCIKISNDILKDNTEIYDDESVIVISIK